MEVEMPVPTGNPRAREYEMEHRHFNFLPPTSALLPNAEKRKKA
jgi:hypothetical protein